jgi:ABC-type transport system involved in multi-copper enzyme maturation permease subunit
MTGLILKDFINLKKNIKIFAILAVLYGFMAFTTSDASFFSSMFTMLIAILTLSVYSYDELAKWDVYALTMPVSREDIVRGKYIIMLLLTFLGAVIGTVITIVIKMIQQDNDFVSGAQSSLLGGAVVILFYCIAMPFITKLGVEKARFIFFAIYLIPFAIIYFIGNAVEAGDYVIPEQLIRFGEKLVSNAAILGPLVLLFALVVSYTISVGVYRKKEF